MSPAVRKSRRGISVSSKVSPPVALVARICMCIQKVTDPRKEYYVTGMRARRYACLYFFYAFPLTDVQIKVSHLADPSILTEIMEKSFSDVTLVTVSEPLKLKYMKMCISSSLNRKHKFEVACEKERRNESRQRSLRRDPG